MQELAEQRKRLRDQKNPACCPQVESGLDFDGRPCDVIKRYRKEYKRVIREQTRFRCHYIFKTNKGGKNWKRCPSMCDSSGFCHNHKEHKMNPSLPTVCLAAEMKEQKGLTQKSVVSFLTDKVQKLERENLYYRSGWRKEMRENSELAKENKYLKAKLETRGRKRIKCKRVGKSTLSMRRKAKRAKQSQNTSTHSNAYSHCH